MPKKYTYSDVKNYIENTSKCKLISVEYKGNKEPLLLTCENCDGYFDISFDHFKGTKKRICNRCSGKHNYSINELKEYIEKNSDCMLLSKEYKNNESLLEFKCGCGEPFYTSFKRFKGLNKRTCDNCTNTKLSEKFRKKHTDFCKQVSSITQSKIVVVGKYRDMKTKVLVQNVVCKHEWKVNPSDILHKRSDCPECNTSKGEKVISEWLNANSFQFTSQYKIKNCKDKRPLPFDFAVFKDNNVVLIEYDGIQHYDNTCWGGKGFEILKKHDDIKSNYCMNNNLKLMRIKYTEYDKISEILSNELT